MDTTTILILALRALLDALSLADSGVRLLGDDPEAHPVGTINELLAALGGEEQVSRSTSVNDAWLIVDRTIRECTALRLWSPC